MRAFLLLAALLVPRAHAYVVLTDLDDTLKITNAAYDATAAWNGLFSTRVFAGMPTYLRGTEGEREALYVLSGSPPLVRGRIKQLLRENRVAYDGLVLRPDLRESALKYKTREISRLMAAHPATEWILIGDDVDSDPEVYAEISRRHPGRVLAIYIRPVRHRAMLPGQIPYLTAFDIALSEELAERLHPGVTSQVAADIMDAPTSRVLPHFVWCPREMGPEFPTTQTVDPVTTGIENRVETICRSRRSATASAF